MCATGMENIVDLGTYSSYRLPSNIRSAFGADTAQELVDQLGVQGELTPALAGEAESAYNAYRQGSTEPARALLGRLGLSDEKIDDALGKLAKA
jgi:hypothetical protein